MSKRLKRTLPADETAPALARQALVDLTSQVPSSVADDLQLLVSELVANAVKHEGLREGETIGLEVRTTPLTAEVRVRYPEHVGFAPALPLEPDEPSQWGLFLVDRISRRWSVVGVEGQLVAWCEVDIPRSDTA